MIRSSGRKPTVWPFVSCAWRGAHLERQANGHIHISTFLSLSLAAFFPKGGCLLSGIAVFTRKGLLFSWKGAALTRKGSFYWKGLFYWKGAAFFPWRGYIFPEWGVACDAKYWQNTSSLDRLVSWASVLILGSSGVEEVLFAFVVLHVVLFRCRDVFAFTSPLSVLSWVMHFPTSKIFNLIIDIYFFTTTYFWKARHVAVSFRLLSWRE